MGNIQIKFQNSIVMIFLKCMGTFSLIELILDYA